MKDENASMYFTVEQGWIKRTSDLGYMALDSPFVWKCKTHEEAEQVFAEVEKSLAHDYRVERQCAGRGWHEKEIYVLLNRYCVVFDEYGDEEILDADSLKETHYGCEEYERDNA